MATLTIKKANQLGAEMVHGTAVKTKVTEIVKDTYIKYIDGVTDQKALVALWEMCATDKPTLADRKSVV